VSHRQHTSSSTPSTSSSSSSFRRRRPAASAAALCTLVTAAALGATPATAQADQDPRLTVISSGQTPLDLPGYGGMAPDDARDSVYVSGGAQGNSIVEVGYDGDVKGTLDKEYGADGLVLSADGKTLYAALAAGDAVVAIDTATFTEKARYPTPAHTCPSSLARTGADVWIGYGCGDAWTGGVGVLDTSAASPTIVLDRQDAKQDVHYQAAPLLAAGAGANGPLAVGQPRLSPVNLAVYQADGATLKLTQSAPRGGSDLADLAVVPDGSAVLSAAGSETGVDAFTPGTLSDTGSYPTSLGPDALAVTQDSKMLAATAAAPASHVYLYRLGESEPAADYWMPLTGAPAPQGLAFGQDGSRLLLVTEPASGSGGPTLTVLQVLSS
jgi:DNA-binding beta-propeller fold protein YncE